MLIITFIYKDTRNFSILNFHDELLHMYSNRYAEFRRSIIKKSNILFYSYTVINLI